MNRGGALFVDEMQFEASPHVGSAKTLLDGKGGHAICAAPFAFIFVGYDGNYYLCCSDWKKEVSFGTVFQHPINALVGEKLDRVKDREPICKSCNWDPLNMLVAELRAVDEGTSDAATVANLVNDMISTTLKVENFVSDVQKVTPPSRRRSIPVTSA